MCSWCGHSDLHKPLVSAQRDVVVPTFLGERPLPLGKRLRALYLLEVCELGDDESVRQWGEFVLYARPALEEDRVLACVDGAEYGGNGVDVFHFVVVAFELLFRSILI